MRILVDAMCARYGGIRTYVEHLLAAWPEVAPDDELIILRPRDLDLDVADHRDVAVDVRAPRVIGRPWAQTRAIPGLVKGLDVDVVLATASTTTIRKPSVPLVVSVLDLRHELLPDQFSHGQRLLRNVSYGRTFTLADGFAAISCRTLEDLHDLHPRTRGKPAAVTHLGADHVDGWPKAPGDGPAVAFAHHTNKKPELVVEAWAELIRRSADVPDLTLVGVGGGRDHLRDRIAGLGLGEQVTVAPFLPDVEFQALMASARMVVFPSDFEGFGIPVVEGMRLGRPVVIGPDRATLEVSDGHAFVMADWDALSLADAVENAMRQTSEQRQSASRHAANFTWSNTALSTRELLARLL